MESEVVKEVIENIVKLSDTILKTMIPQDAKRHFRAACKEALLGMIAIIDHADEKQEAPMSKDIDPEKPSIHTINITE